ncbi:universal stress protein [Streptomyces sp. SCSIO ZS0520]|uniref:universal stress protein n=1 Tax=Streptomyces sp. SCSIO ZS0520 TaxID=2892996 RepID=UPI0021DA4C09|nr:universal stress protein [Streptomyces sp. SCSIO ZS0520]
MRQLVVGVDGSAGGWQAVDWAVDQAARTGLPLRIVYASLWQHYARRLPAAGRRRPDEHAYADQLLGTALARARTRQLQVPLSAVTEAGEPVEVLLREARGAAQLVVGPRGDGGIVGMMLGSVGLSVAARALCPVVVARGTARNREATDRPVVVGVGEGPGAVAALRFAFGEAARRGGELVAVRAWRAPAGSARAAGPAERQWAERRLGMALAEAGGEHPEVRVSAQTVQGPPPLVLVEAAAEAALLVLAVPRGESAHGLQLGRTSHVALHHADCPVAVVPVPH